MLKRGRSADFRRRAEVRLKVRRLLSPEGTAPERGGVRHEAHPFARRWRRRLANGLRRLAHGLARRPDW
jgi:hypothetical protein